MKKITIAIDGFSSCGKSTMAKDLAKKIGYVYVDTGAMYRAVTFFALQHKLFSADNKVDTAKLEALMPEIHISFELNPTTGHPDTYLNGECIESKIRLYVQLWLHSNRQWVRKKASLWMGVM